MRTPNTKCSICKKPLYRRPFEFKNGREFCCVGCRSELYKKREVSPNLELGRKKGLNKKGHKNSLAERKKRIKTLKEFYKKYPEVANNRGLKMRGSNHYNWKNGATTLQLAIRTSAYNLKWIRKILKRDNRKCQICKNIKKIEVHHKIGIARLIKEYKIKTLDDARNCKAFWDINNGIVVCKKCHYKIHNKKYYED